MSYVNKAEVIGYYFKNHSIRQLLHEITEFIADGRNALFQLNTEEIVIEWDNQVGMYIASLYLRK